MHVTNKQFIIRGGLLSSVLLLTFGYTGAIQGLYRGYTGAIQGLYRGYTGVIQGLTKHRMATVVDIIAVNVCVTEAAAPRASTGRLVL